ncbi:MAG: hypothetical protein KBS63_05010 [Clostridiales bacterium]|nr:hypothetical protein [Candidatus Crickella caballi]
MEEMNKMLENNEAEDSGRELRERELATEIIGLARNTLFVEFRFMQRAVSHIETEVYEGANNVLFACNGQKLYYDARYVLGRYKENQNLINRSILHSLLHCIFHHDWTGKEIDFALWNLATDIAVENTINEMCAAGRTNAAAAFSVPAMEARQKFYLDTLHKELSLLNAENIYKYLADMLPEDKQEGRGIVFIGEGSGDESEPETLRSKYIKETRELFRLDQHMLWMNASDGAAGDDAVDAMRVWQDLSKKMQIELETMHSGQDVLCANLQSVNRTRRSYAQFLRRFGEHGEIMRLSDDEFDNNYYAYGMELYGNIPLIEYLEYREQKHIKEFVVAIDTSGSVQGETVQKFVQRTYDLIKSQESFDLRIKLHIIQCDDRVREDALITSDDEFDRYIESMQILGLGKTDFRPVFEHVDKLLGEHQLTNLAGLLYFTDGKGTFPTKKPAYDTAFIIHTDEVYPPEVPSWAMRLILEDDFQ